MSIYDRTFMAMCDLMVARLGWLDDRRVMRPVRVWRVHDLWVYDWPGSLLR